MNLKINGLNVDDVNFSALGNVDDCFKASGLRSATAPVNSSMQLSFTYNKPTSSSAAWLDYYEIHCARNLSYNESFMPFMNLASSTSLVSEYQLSNLPSTAKVFEISDPLNVSFQNTYQSGANSVFRSSSNGKIKQYALSDGNYTTPFFEGEVANQNLHGTGVVQFIIVTEPNFMEASNKLANFHRNYDNMDVLVVTPQEIYNEFSSGSQDISAIRDFFRLVYYKNTNPVNRLKFAMFMGDASYDFKNKLENNTNFIPVYESDPKLGIPYSIDYYCSDDFYGYLDSLDGSWFNEQRLEISVNRLPVASATEAMQVVDKIINYKDIASLGEWRNFVSLCADDADEFWEQTFVEDFEEVSRFLDTTVKNINIRKVYLDAFKQENLGGSQRYPDAQAAIKKEFEQGTLIFNYVGHGGEEYLATEKVIDIPLITSMNNINNLPAFFTATCEFSRYDDAKRKSAGEYVITQNAGGAVAMFTTVRVVYAGANAALTNYFWTNCAFVKQGGKWPTLGDIYKKLKNWPGQNENDRKFTLFGDPALRLNYPEFIVKIDSINQASVNGQQDTIKALNKVTFKGHIEDLNGVKQTGFNGKILPIVYDKQSTFYTLSNDLLNGELPFKLYSNILYKGENSVNNGDYSFTFVVPRHKL
ncbi:MAG: type IX secretion system sortase PorU [Bacteroidia bacterium]